ncbi:MAG: DUF2236 domain-containing protein [Cytophagales bacterium]|nr:MAG: DUF2236 domain-containing protein [Cytophagales bacterium]
MTAARIKQTRVFNDDFLEPYRHQGDAPADAVIATIVAEGGREGVGSLMRWLADAHDFATDKQHPAIQQFFADYSNLPPWADRARMQRGMAFFQKHAGAVGLVLGTLSLPYTYLGANGVQVLWLTERIKNDTARRLQETGEWVFAVNNLKNWRNSTRSTVLTPSPYEGEGAGGEVATVYTLKIRLIHAASRWFAGHTGRWNDAWGTPICQEDMAGTIGAFSYIVLRGLRKLGVAMTEREEEDYLHHINVVGHINGVVDELLPQNLREAFHLDKQIARRQFAPTEAGRGLTQSLLNAIAQLTGRDDARNLAAAQMRFFLGDTYADALGIPRVPLEQGLVNVVSRLPIFAKILDTENHGGTRRGTEKKG